MEPREYDVEVVYRQRAIYRVRAADREEAERVAMEVWQRGGASEVPGYDWCEMEAVYASEGAEPQRTEQDAELVLRFLQQREQLIARLGGGVLGPSANDAISAGQVASDLGWSRRGPNAGGLPDVPRAISALELLCRSKRVVCFERPRVRTGERGEIRLYCTREYLERLSAAMNPLERQAS